MSLNQLVDISNRYGADDRYVLAGGGNTSWKNDSLMYVKASGTELSSIKAEGFVKMDLGKMDGIWKKEYAADQDQREEQVLADMMEARFPSEEGKRPSVEALLHALFPYTWVVHTHPALVNGLTCGREGEAAAAELFGDEAIWVPVTDPGYILAKKVLDMAQTRTSGGEAFPKIVFLQNHGVFVAGHTEEEIDEIYARLFEKISGRLTAQPGDDTLQVSDEAAAEASDVLKRALGDDLTIIPFANEDILEMSRSAEDFEPLSLSFTPDHIVYYGFKPVYSESVASLQDAIRAYWSDNGVPPRLAVVKDLGAFSFNASASMAEKGKVLFLDDVRVAVYVRSFGGHQFMPEVNIDFIRNWEVEKYRASVSH